MTPTQAERGYALVAAVAAILFFAIITLGVLTLTQRVIATGSAEVDAARASAAADAGIALALRTVLANSLTEPVRLNGTPRRMQFDGARLDIVMTDERGKVPLNLLDDTQVTALLQSAGLSGEPLAIARDSYLDWIDDDDEPRTNGAEYLYYSARGLRPRNSGFVTVGELGRVRGLNAGLVQKIAAIATTDFGNGSFDPRSASPAALAVMDPRAGAAVGEIVRTREAEGQVTALGFTDQASLVARPFTIAVRASYASGAAASRRCVVELTGAAHRPYVIRHCS